MTLQEFQYIKRALEVYETQELSLEDQRKVLQTISEITAKAAVKTQEKLVDSLIA
jgi:division protein CdvB (Snf7/Vps24/ESCRT-III family)